MTITEPKQETKMETDIRAEEDDRKKQKLKHLYPAKGWPVTKENIPNSSYYTFIFSHQLKQLCSYT